jgi:hypothetical protein
MKPHILTYFLVIALVSVVRGDETKLKDIFALDKVDQFVFVDEVPVGDDFGYERTKLVGDTEGALAKALTEVSQHSYTTKPNYPFIGILARVMLLNNDGDPICTMQVVNWNRTVVFYGVTTKEGKILIDDRYAILESEALARWVYDQVRTKIPDEFKRMQEMYARNDHSIETLLFPKPTNSEQGGADQPATALESKSEGKEKPKPEVEGRSR